jgi:hypothetical protein
MKYSLQNNMTEWSFRSTKDYADPFNEVELDLLVTDPEGQERRIPAFWAGEQEWQVRYASSRPGLHHYRTVCSDRHNSELHDRTGQIEITAYTGSNPLLKHGFLRIAADRRHLEHQDGTPFFWLGDTWWMGLCRRLAWPSEFQELVADRVAKGFTVIQIVAGLYPDMEPFDQRGANEAGFPWTEDFARINPAYFDMADLRLGYLVRSGLVPCIFGNWGYYIEYAGPAVLKKHWRYLIARYGAYPVVWCAAGEALMGYYLKAKEEKESQQRLQELRANWTDMINHIRATDPYDHPITIHPTRYGHDQVDDPAVLNIDMLQTGHSGYPTLATTVNMLTESLTCEPKMPVLVGEANYEGILESSREEMQRFLFWSCILSGAAGHTYGANGLWQVNSTEAPYGPSPHGTSWGNLSWREAYQLPGSGQIGLARRLLVRYPWWQFEAQPSWIEPGQNEKSRMLPYAAGVPGQVRVIFIPADAIWLVWRGEVMLKALEPELNYQVFYFDPKTGAEYALGVTAGSDSYRLPKPPIFQDWVLVLERR